MCQKDAARSTTLSSDEMDIDMTTKKGKSVKMASIADMFRDSTGFDRFVMFIGAMTAFASGLSSPLFMFIFGQLARAALASNVGEMTSQFAVIMLTAGAAIFLLTAVQKVCWLFTAARLVGGIRTRYFNAVLRQDMNWHDEHKPGELLSRVTGDILTIENGIGDKLSKGVSSLGTAVFGFFFALISSWEITVFILSGLPIAAIICGVLLILINRFSYKAQEQHAVAVSIATEVMENIKTTQVFNREIYEANRFSDSLHPVRVAGIWREFLTGAAAGIITAIMLVTLGGGFVFASYLVEKGRGDVGDISSSILAILYSCIGLALMVPSIVAFMDSRTAAYHLIETIDHIPEVDIDALGIPFEYFGHCIVFKFVSFQYKGCDGKPVFLFLNFTIRKGQKVAFTGATGTGKSTIIRLIQRFYDPTKGMVLVDGKDLRLFSLYDWRQQIGVVSQEPNLFSGTILDNIRVGQRNADLDDVVEACKKANIHDTIMKLPDMYNTMLGEGQLSGGQKQRLAIARALVKKPAILILDEATSALDRKSELETQQALDILIKEEGITVIVIAHRLSTIRHMDCIYHLENLPGKGSYIAEYGTYDDLLRKNGYFAALAMTQIQTRAPLKTARGMNNSFYLYTDEPFDGSNIFEEIDENVPDSPVYSYKEELQDDIPLSKNDDSFYDVPFEDLAEWEVNQTNVSFWRMLSFSGRRWAIFIGAIGSFLDVLVFPGTAILYGNMVSIVGSYNLDNEVGKMRTGVVISAILFLALAALSIGGSLLQGFYGYAGEHLKFTLRTFLFRAILRQDQTFFDIPGRDPGAMTSILSGDCEVVHRFWRSATGSFVRATMLLVTGIFIGIFFQWKVALLSMACMPVLIGSIFIQERVLFSYKTEKVDEVLHTIACESFTAISTITSFNLKNRMVRRYSRAVAKSQGMTKRLGVISALNAGLMQFMIYTTAALAFWYGGKLVDGLEATFQEVMIAVMSVMMCLMGAGMEVESLVKEYINAKNAAKRILSISDRVPDVDVFEPGDEDVGEGCDIKFEKVQFFYPSRPEISVLDSTDLHFYSGTSNGLIGQTGCGKSTIIQLLARFYNPTNGRLFVNGRDITNIDISSWRSNVSIVLQEPSLFSGTVMENIRYSREDATDEEVVEASRVACIHEDILQMIDGYNTQVGYRGRELSGGQKQRIAIARGVLRRPKLLLLDEATSALDNATEAAVQHNLDDFQCRYGTTTVCVAHRLTTIRHCDQIFLLDVGKTIEKGSHDDLISSNGEYKARWELAQ